jgi:hypothetical protein
MFIVLENFKTVFESFVTQVQVWSEKMLQFARGEVVSQSTGEASEKESSETLPVGGIDPSFFMRI